MKRALIFGAGKIGRGFLAHLLTRSNYAITFVEASPVMASLLQTRNSYHLHVLGAADRSTDIRGFRTLAANQVEEIALAVAEHDLMFTAVGGPNLHQVARLLALGLNRRLGSSDRSPVNVIICENYKHPAQLLRQALIDAGGPELATWSAHHLGLVETQVLRSCIEPTDEMRAQDPLSLQVQNWWVLPCDADALRGPVPEIEGLSPRAHFANELLRKLYTYNCSNAAIGYVGYLSNHTMLADAANDPAIRALVEQVNQESNDGLIQEFRFDRQEQIDLQTMAIEKYRDRRIADPIERNCRDSKRKLSQDDRLIAPALLALKHGRQPRALAVAIAAALHYDGSDDPGTREVQAYLREHGLVATMGKYCKLPADHPLVQLVVASVTQLTRFNRRSSVLISR